MTASGMATNAPAIQLNRSADRWPRRLMPQAATMQPRPMRRAVVMSQPRPGSVHDQVAAPLSGRNSWVTRQPDDRAEDGQQGRPRQPVAEHGQRAGQGEVLSPAFPGVERDPRLVGEHGRRLGVDVRLQQSRGLPSRPTGPSPRSVPGQRPRRQSRPDRTPARTGRAAGRCPTSAWSWATAGIRKRQRCRSWRSLILPSPCLARSPQTILRCQRGVFAEQGAVASQCLREPAFEGRFLTTNN